MRSGGVVALVMVLSAALPGVASADSDGYYCVGRSYLAYQFGMAPMPIAPHRLHVITTHGPQGIPEPAILELPQFQVHGMLCGDGWIDVASFTVIYRITLDSTDRPVRYEARSSLEGQRLPQEFIRSQMQNLGAFAGGRALLSPIRASLATKPAGGEYLLEVTARAIEPVKACELSITSRIVETDTAGREISQRIIFQGRGHRECFDGAERAATPLHAVPSLEAQRSLEALLKVPELDATVRIAALQRDKMPVDSVLGDIRQLARLVAHQDPNVPELTRLCSVTLANGSLEQALDAVLRANGIAYTVLRPTEVLVYSDTPANRATYGWVVRTFELRHADPDVLAQFLNQQAFSSAGIRPVIVPTRASRTISVRATGEKMAIIAKLIADNDKRS